MEKWRLGIVLSLVSIAPIMPASVQVTGQGTTIIQGKKTRNTYEDFTTIFTLKTPFSVINGKLALRAKPPYVDPVEASTRLYLRLLSQDLEIDNFNKLHGRVRIETPQAALAFARLRTSRRTFYAFPPDQPGVSEMEIIAKEEITPDLLYGDRAMAEAMTSPKTMEGYCGFIYRKTAQQLGITSAKCIPFGKGYKVQRVLFVKDLKKNTQRIVRRTEWVGKIGEYKQKEDVILYLPQRPFVFWVVPQFE